MIGNKLSVVIMICVGLALILIGIKLDNERLLGIGVGSIVASEILIIFNRKGN